MPLSVAQASIVMVATLVASRVLGWVRLSVIGAQFGGSPRDLDAFWAAFRIPDTIFNLLVAGALASAFIPVFSGYLAKENEKEAWRIASSVMNAMLLLLIALSAVMWVFAPTLMPLLAPDFTPAQLELSTRLTRIMLLSPIFMGLSSLFTGVLNSYRQFLSGATAPLVYNFVIVLFALFAAPFLGINALAYGVVAGALMMWLVQVPELTFRSTKYTLALDLGHPGVREIARLTGPRTLALGAVQVVFFVDLNLASRMPPGSLTALTYAFQLLLLPLGVFSIAISAAVFPALSRYAAQGLQVKLRDALEQSIRWILLLTLPAAVMLIVLRRPIVHLLFQWKDFGPDLREATAAAFLLYAIGLVGHALVQIVARGFYAIKDTRTPFVLTVITIAVNIALSVLLAPSWGISGLALANSIATLLEAALLLALLAPRARLRLAKLGGASLTFAVASAVMGGAMFLFIRITNVTVDLDETKLGLLLQTLLAMSVGALAFLGVASVLRIAELGEIRAALRGGHGPGPDIVEGTPAAPGG